MKVVNPLNEFNSYSYHHALILTGSTRVVESLSTNDFPYSSLLKMNRIGEGFRVQRKKIVYDAEGQVSIEDDFNVNPSDDSFVIVTNGAQDAEVFVERLEWQNMFAPNFQSQGVHSYSTMALDGTMILSEPRGSRFLQFLNSAYDALGIDPMSGILIVKTFFVGQTVETYSSISSTDVVTNVPPLPAFITDVTGSFNETGAKYELQFVGINNGASKLDQFSFPLDDDIGGIQAYEGIGSAATSSTLSSAMKKLENVVNNRYSDFVRSISSNNPNFDQEYRTIQYEINLDDSYIDNSYIIDQHKLWNSEETENSGTTITFPPGSTLENAIQRIMSMCSKVAKEADGVQTSGSVKKSYVYKILSSVESSLEQQDGADNSVAPFKVRYDIVRYEINSVSSNNKEEIVNFTDYDPDDPNILEYDYIFTGKNVDVLEFDMELNTGLLFLMTYKTNDSIPDTKEELNQKFDSSGSIISGNDYDFKGNRKRKLLLPPRLMGNTLSRHMRDSTADGSFRTSLNSHAALGALDATIKIRGNPLLLGSLLDSSNNLSPTAPLKDWERVAGKIKVNVKMPSGDPNNPDDYESFWYQGAYSIIAVLNLFDINGNFVQELELIPAFTKSQFGFLTNAENSNYIDNINDSAEWRVALERFEQEGVAAGDEGIDDFFRPIVSRTLSHEGGLAKNPNDPGGITNYGISINNLLQRKWRDENGILIGDKDKDGVVSPQDIENLTRQDAIDIYKKFYWDPFRINEIPDLELAYQVFDMGVNSGPTRSIILLQQALVGIGFSYLSIDGNLGDNTLSAIESADMDELVSAMRMERLDYYEYLAVNNPSLAIFLPGWRNRV